MRNRSRLHLRCDVSNAERKTHGTERSFRSGGRGGTAETDRCLHVFYVVFTVYSDGENDIENPTGTTATTRTWRTTRRGFFGRRKAIGKTFREILFGRRRRTATRGFCQRPPRTRRRVVFERCDCRARVYASDAARFRFSRASTTFLLFWNTTASRAVDSHEPRGYSYFNFFKVRHFVNRDTEKSFSSPG